MSPRTVKRHCRPQARIPTGFVGVGPPIPQRRQTSDRLLREGRWPRNVAQTFLSAAPCHVLKRLGSPTARQAWRPAEQQVWKPALRRNADITDPLPILDFFRDGRLVLIGVVAFDAKLQFPVHRGWLGYPPRSPRFAWGGHLRVRNL